MTKFHAGEPMERVHLDFLGSLQLLQEEIHLY